MILQEVMKEQMTKMYQILDTLKDYDNQLHVFLVLYVLLPVVGNDDTAGSDEGGNDEDASDSG